MASNIAMTVTFEDVANRVIAAATKFVEEYGGDLDEAVADAMYHYIEAFDSYKEFGGTSSFGGWVSYLVYHRLLDTHKKKMRRLKLAPTVPLQEEEEWREGDDEVVNEPEGLAVDDKPFNLNLFLMGLSNDAASVVQMVFDTPKVLEKDIRKRPGGANPYNIRIALRVYLRRVVEWSKERVQSVFSEIQEALTP